MMPLAVIPAVAGVRAIGALAILVAGLSEHRRRRSARPAAEPVETRSGTQLARRKLSQDDLDMCDLREADLHRAALRNRNLAGRDLTAANLTSAHLDGSVLAGARLDRAELSWASLRGCDLQGASLVGTQLVEADLRSALLHGADLSTTSGLETVLWREATADPSTRWPASFDARAAGVVIERAARP